MDKHGLTKHADSVSASKALSQEIGQSSGRFSAATAYEVLRSICLHRDEFGLPSEALIAAFKFGLKQRGENDNTIRPYAGTLRMALRALEAGVITTSQIVDFDMNRLRSEISGGDKRIAASLMATFRHEVANLDPTSQVDLLIDCLNRLRGGG